VSEKSLKFTEKVFAENYDKGPPENIHFKKGEEVQIYGGYDLKL
jgi:hypothetical protein